MVQTAGTHTKSTCKIVGSPTNAPRVTRSLPLKLWEFFFFSFFAGTAIGACSSRTLLNYFPFLRSLLDQMKMEFPPAV